METVVIRIRYLIAVVLLIAITGCNEAPGEGRKAEEGYRLAEPIIVALEQYHEDKGEYPASLEDLIPDYLDEIPSGEWIEGFRYDQDQDSYALSFDYVGPCMNTCTYIPGKGWDCGGFC